MKKMYLLYVLLLIPLAHLFIFQYIPIYGLSIAFKDFRYADGILGSKWNDFKHFIFLFTTPSFFRILRNTVTISLLRLAFEFPTPIIFALLLNEISRIKFKKIVQTISYLPHFMSWVVLGGIMMEILSPQRGVVNYIISLFGIEPIHFLASRTWFIPVLIGSSVYQSVGWGAVIYLASLTSINPELYESAEIDGANRFQKAIYISIPGLKPIIVILLILNLGGILNAGFDQIFNMYNPLVYSIADIIDTFVYRTGILDAKYDFATAVGLFKNGVGVILIVGANLIVRRYSDYAVW